MYEDLGTMDAIRDKEKEDSKERVGRAKIAKIRKADRRANVARNEGSKNRQIRVKVAKKTRKRRARSQENGRETFEVPR